MKKEPLFFLKHMLEAIEDIESFSKGISKKDLKENKLIRSAIVKQIEIIGESVKNLPIDCTVKYPYVNWSDIAKTRDKLTHQYFRVDTDFVWSIIKYDLPTLKKDMIEIIEKESKKKA
jgi:uncharacterized protein with HEPN domain